MKVTVSRQELAAALLFASNDETRYVINGVLIEARAGKQPLIVATDGRRLVSIESVAAQDETACCTEDYSFVLSPGFIKPICALTRTFGGKAYPWIALGVTPGSKTVTVEHIGGFFELTCRELALTQGDFPKWRACVPQKSKKREPVTHIGLNAEFVGDFSKAAKILGSKMPLIQMSLVGKDSSVEVKISGLDSFYGLLMQCQADETVEYQPEFLAIVKDFPKPGEDTDEEIMEDIEAVEPEAETEATPKKKRSHKKKTAVEA